LAPLATIEALKNADVCLFDALAPKKLLEYIPPTAETIFVGKRNKVHSKKQTEINKLISFYAKQGKRVVRLKGGDPGIYGRLSEEVNEMEENKIPFTVIPALSSFIAATTTSGLLLTRRSISRGFRVITPRRENSEDYHKLNYNDFTETPLVYFMAITKVKDIVAELIENGVSPEIESAIFYSVGTDNEEVITAPLSEIEKYAIDTHPQKGPGLLVVGKVMNPKYIFPNNGLFANKRILVTGSEAIQEKSKKIIEANGGKYINHQLVKLSPTLEISDKLLFEYDYIILTSPTAVKMFMKQIYSNKIDIRKIPQIISCGQGTTNEFVKHNIFPEITAENDFGSKGIIESIRNKVSKDKKILKLSSNLASTEITAFLSENGNSFDDLIFYKNDPICNNELKEFDTIYFASSSAVEAFFKCNSELSLINKEILVIGEPTKKKLIELLNGEISIIMGDIATTEGVFDSYKVKLIEDNILKSKNKGEIKWKK
jgi:uroporphyrinogen III methyltransferase/synthase